MDAPPFVRVVACAVVLAVAGRALAQGEAGQRVHRCVGAHGEIAFSGLPCDAGRSGAGADGAGREAQAPPADSCPASFTELRDRLAAAVARHDANAVAGLIRWHGIGGRAAGRRLHELRELVRRPLLALDADDGLSVRTGGAADGGVRSHAFGVEVEGGCHWLRW